MPVTPTYPGVYIEEIPSVVRTITGVATSITAFIWVVLWGPVDTPVTIQSISDFERNFGGLWSASTLGYAVQQFFLNGGSTAIVVRVVHLDDAVPANNATLATFPTLAGPGGGLNLVAANVGLGEQSAGPCSPEYPPAEPRRDPQHPVQPVREGHGDEYPGGLPEPLGRPQQLAVRGPRAGRAVATGRG